jgi:hypothetical protein
MDSGVRGSLISIDAVVAATPVDPEAHAGRRVLRECHEALLKEAGPAWAARTVFDRIAVPFCRAFGLQVIPFGGDARLCRGFLNRGGSLAGVLLAFPWGHDAAATWRDSVQSGIAAGSRWCFSVSGPAVRIYDAQRTHSRRFIEFDIPAVCQQTRAFAIAWSILASSTGIDDAVLQSERHRAVVRDSLQAGVHEALRHLTRAFASVARPRGHRTRASTSAFDESLVVIYRVLFLLFAEARGLVPAWHPVFRDSYTVGALRPSIETLPRPRGVWEALQAIARLAHRGCRAGTLRVPPFNGRLFSPGDAPLADSAPLDEAAVRQALLALTTRRTKAGRERIAYGDLGVEHLGGVYERVLDYEIGPDERGAPSLIRSGRRRATGTFYTPRSLTEYVVRRTLAPLVAETTPDQVLGLRVLDPAMGSGAFLVAACRYLANAYERALIREGGVSEPDLTDSDRAGFRRTVAQRCLFGVDLNPMAVQLARLSLWLATLSGDRPLTFFDHHLRTGNSLVGASVADLRQRRPGRSSSKGPLPLLDLENMDDLVGQTVVSRETLRVGLEDTLAQVREKEQRFADLQREDAPLSRWKSIADLWCAAWFDTRARAVSRAAFEALMDDAIGRPTVLPGSLTAGVLACGREAAQRERFFHWELEFPEIFYDAAGAPLEAPGFDAIIANPPWEMLRGDAGDADARRSASRAASALTAFARGSGVYRLQGGGQANLYQMFVERMLSLVRRQGRLGLVLPSGFASDHGSARLRGHLLRSARIDSFVIAENREALFPIHRGLKFLLMTLSKETCDSEAVGHTAIPVRAGIHSVAEFDRLPDVGPDPYAVSVPLRLIQQLSGDQFAVPELRTQADGRIAARIAFSFAPAGSADGWNLEFGRELNATDDRKHMNRTGDGLPVIEGKHIAPFTVDVGASGTWIRERQAEHALGRRPFDRSRIAYRDVAAASNRLTLIAAVLPPGVVTTHTLFCLRTLLDEEAQQFVVGMLNSFVANYMVRLRVTTHVTVAIIERLPLPKPSRGSRDAATVTDCARVLSGTPGDVEVQAKLQAAAARLYGLDAEAFAHILGTFPLIDQRIRAASISAFTRTI